MWDGKSGLSAGMGKVADEMKRCSLKCSFPQVVEAVCSQPPVEIKCAKRHACPKGTDSEFCALRALVFDRRLRADRLYNQHTRCGSLRRNGPGGENFSARAPC